MFVSVGSKAIAFKATAMRGAVSAAQLVIIVALVVLAAVAAWWFMGTNGPGKSPATAPVTIPATATPGTPTASVPAAVEDLTPDQLYKAARSAMSDNRMVAPAGNNALEYYLQILAKTPDDSGAKDALRELFPFATGSAEDQINQGNFDEAARITNLLSKADPSNYTLTILRSKLDAKKKQNDREQQQLSQQAAAAAAAAAASRAASTAAAAPAETAAAPTTAASGTAATPTATAAPKTEVARATPPPSAAPPPAPVGETRDVQVVTPPRPSYPTAAARNRQDGWVEVEFTVGTDGSVQSAKVVASNPTRVFDREAVRAIEAAKFQPRLDKGQAVATTLRRRIEFKLGN